MFRTIENINTDKKFFLENYTPSLNTIEFLPNLKMVE